MYRLRGGSLSVRLISVMKKRYRLILTILLLLTCTAQSNAVCEVLILRDEAAPLSDIVNEFRKTVRCETKEMISQGYSPGRANNADMIFAVGVDAVTATAKVDRIPVIFTAIKNSHYALSSEKPNFHSVRLNVSLARQIAIIARVMPDVRRIGILYNPQVSGTLLGDAQSAAAQNEIELVTRRIVQPKDVAAALNGLKGKIDALLLIPDHIVITPDTTDFIGLYSLEQRIPVVAFSPKYLKLGAAMTISASPADVGKKAALLAQMLLAGDKVGRNSDVDVPQVDVNEVITRRLGIKVDYSAIKGMK